MNRPNRPESPAEPETPAVQEPAPAENPNASDEPTIHTHGHPAPPHPCCIGIATAWDMVAGGQTREAAADWLARNYPQHFATSTDAGNAMETEAARLRGDTPAKPDEPATA